MPCILIVDDEATQLTLIRETLSSAPDFTFVEARDGKQAVEYARTHHPDLVLLDVMMPEMDGYQVCRILKSDPILKNIPIILVSALGHAEDRAVARDLGAFDFINKPFEESDLHAIVRRALES
jgi:CheY-like chemotaxis protein